jgi:mRNA-degrading endonuclease RelE of RelBE toxin-antitoxin system
MREILIEKSLKRKWQGENPATRQRVGSVLDEVAATRKPTDHNSVILMDGVHETVYRLRVGNYRVVFSCNNGKLFIWRLGDRASVYANIQRVINTAAF